MAERSEEETGPVTFQACHFYPGTSANGNVPLRSFVREQSFFEFMDSRQLIRKVYLYHTFFLYKMLYKGIDMKEKLNKKEMKRKNK